MDNSGADRNLLFGLLALQNGLIDQAQLVAAFQAWTLEKDRPLAEHLVARGDLDADDRGVVEALVARHLKKHGGSTAKSLAALPAGRSTQRSLAGLDDPELAASLAGLPGVGAGPTPAASGPSTSISGRRRRRQRPGRARRRDEDDHLARRPARRRPDDRPPAADGGDGEPRPRPAGRYQLLGEIARGGMGSVLRGRDPDLGRDLALKVLLDHHRDRPDLVDRFVEEAQICGQLQHPGVVPVYELGTLADHRPFFTMKLVKGQTLAALLAERSAPSRRPAAVPVDLRGDLPDDGLRPRPGRDPPRPEAVQRDGRVVRRGAGDGLGPGQGLAQGWSRRRMSLTPPANETVVATLRSKGDSDLSQAGSVLGTPAYMAPEQARGETEADRPPGRRLRAGLDPLRDPHRGAGVRWRLGRSRSFERRGGRTRPRRWPGWSAAGPTASSWPWPATAWPPMPRTGRPMREWSPSA